MFDYFDRINRIRKIITQHHCDAFLSFCPVDNRYLSGFSGSTSALIITLSHNFFLTDFRYLEQSHFEVNDYPIIIVQGNLEKEVSNVLKSQQLHTIAINPEKINLSLLENLKRYCDCDFVPIQNDLSMLRVKKDDNEVNLIREACKITEKVVFDSIKNLKEGITEKELSARIDYEFRLHGADGSAFDTIVLFGERSSLPHGKPTDRALKIGDIVLVDCGCIYKGYCADLTRTFVFGVVPAIWFLDIYTTVLEAQTKTLSNLKSKMSAKEADNIARYLISAKGYGSYFGHGLGHGIGLEIHEPPRLNKESDVVLEEGFVVTIEPGVYLPNRGGVRIEDTVLITKNGCERLTTSEKDFFIISL